MRPTVAVAAADITLFLRQFLVRSVSARNETQLVADLHLVGQTVNKRAPGSYGSGLCFGLRCELTCPCVV